MKAKTAATLSTAQVVDMLKAQCTAAGSGAEFAKLAGVSAPYLNDVIHGRRPPADAICSALGIERVVVYRKAKK